MMSRVLLVELTFKTIICIYEIRGNMLLIYLIDLLFSNPVQFVITIALIIVPLLISITFHEWAHGYVAYKFGDMTPKLQGRLTLNPFAHLDPVGTLMLFIIGIGWAKPVMLNPLNYPSKTKQMLVALAGPVSNILLAVTMGFILVSFQLANPHETGEIFKTIVMSFNIVIRINLILAIFNLIPIPPLDGSRVLAWMLPKQFEAIFIAFEPYGILLILILFFSGGINLLIKTVDFVQSKLLLYIKVFVLSHFS